MNLGRIKWARSLVCHLAELIESVTTHPVLKSLPAALELSKRHKSATTTLKAYENDMVAIWMNQHVCITNNIYFNVFYFSANFYLFQVFFCFCKWNYYFLLTDFAEKKNYLDLTKI